MQMRRWMRVNGGWMHAQSGWMNGWMDTWWCGGTLWSPSFSSSSTSCKTCAAPSAGRSDTWSNPEWPVGECICTSCECNAGGFPFLPSWRSGVSLTLLTVAERVLYDVDDVISHVLVLVLFPNDGTEEYVLSLFFIFNAMPSTTLFYMSGRIRSK